MKTIKFDTQLKIYIIEDTEIGAVINLTEKEFNQLMFDASVEKLVSENHFI